MRFLELLQKKFFPKAYQEKQFLMHQKTRLTPQHNQKQYSPNANHLDSSATKNSEQVPAIALQRSRAYEGSPKSRPAWLQKLEAVLPSPQHPIRRFWRRYHIGKLLMILIGTLVLLLGSYLFYLSKTAKVSDLQDALKATTVIYDHKGEYAGSLSGQKGSYVELNAISDDLENAVIATEDRTFYSNSGINLKRFLLAVVTAGRFEVAQRLHSNWLKMLISHKIRQLNERPESFFWH
ncbi:penicillin-binding protein 2a [Streptococcus pyogenes]|nr:penicillin-binding protein 2a [Streptococcus pyogenes]